MKNNLNELILYRNICDDSTFSDVLNSHEVSRAVGELVTFAEKHGLCGNIWHGAIAYQLAIGVNSFSLACERRAAPTGSLRNIALHDFQIIFEMLPITFFGGEDENVLNYSACHRNEDLCALAKKLGKAKSSVDIFDAVSNFYREHGTGEFAFSPAFALRDYGDCELIKMNFDDNVSLDELVGYEYQKSQLVENTEAFLYGGVSNNCLLYGDSGTGKSTCVKAILSTYYPAGLRIIQIHKHQFRMLPGLISKIRDRNYKFILYMDDLSFEENELEYKYLKAVIEGGLEAQPANTVIYATSNRRHLIRETFSDRNDMQHDDDIHLSDTVEEKMSLVYRFGYTIYFGKPSPQEYIHIVKTLAARHPEISMAEENLVAEARRWEMNYGGFSGRTAQQFVTHLLGRYKK